MILRWRRYRLKNFGATESNHNSMVQGLGNMVHVAFCPSQAVTAFEEWRNLCEVSHCLGETIYFSCWIVLAFSVEVYHIICPTYDSRRCVIRKNLKMIALKSYQPEVTFFWWISVLKILSYFLRDLLRLMSLYTTCFLCLIMCLKNR